MILLYDIIYNLPNILSLNCFVDPRTDIPTRLALWKNFVGQVRREIAGFVPQPLIFSRRIELNRPFTLNFQPPRCRD